MSGFNITQIWLVMFDVALGLIESKWPVALRCPLRSTHHLHCQVALHLIRPDCK